MGLTPTSGQKRRQRQCLLDVVTLFLRSSRFDRLWSCWERGIDFLRWAPTMYDLVSVMSSLQASKALATLPNLQVTLVAGSLLMQQVLLGIQVPGCLT